MSDIECIRYLGGEHFSTAMPGNSAHAHSTGWITDSESNFAAHSVNNGSRERTCARAVVRCCRAVIQK